MGEPAYDIDRALRRYLAQVGDKRLVARDARDEIESHLRDEIDDHLAHGLTAREAFERAIAVFGSGPAVLAEYDKLYRGRRLAQLRNLLTHYFDGRIVMRLVLGVFLGIFFMLLGLLLEGGQLSSLIGVTAFIIVIGGAFGALIVAFPASTVAKSMVLALTGRQATKAGYIDAARVFKAFGDFALLSGFVSVLFGTIHVLENLDKLDMIGPGLAVAIVGVLYGLLAKMFIGRALASSFTARAYPSAEPVDRSDHDELMTA